MVGVGGVRWYSHSFFVCFVFVVVYVVVNVVVVKLLAVTNHIIFRCGQSIFI